jgi:hypothetical protein
MELLRTRMSQGKALLGRQDLDNQSIRQPCTQIDPGGEENFKFDISIGQASKAALDQLGSITQIREALIASAGSRLPTLRSARADLMRAPRAE